MAYSQTLAGFISGVLQAYNNTTDAEWHRRHAVALDSIQKELLPSGSGIDCGTVIELDRSKVDRLVFKVEFHHMDEYGGYSGWRTYHVIARPAFQGINISVTGGTAEIRDYLGDLFHQVLMEQDSYDESRGNLRAPWYHKISAYRDAT